MTQTGYEATEKLVGKALMEVRKESLEEAIAEEKKLTTETYSTEEDGELPACTFSVDMGWNQKGSGRTYDSPTGTLNAIGVKSGKICNSQTLCKKCHKCDKLAIVTKKNDKAIEGKKKENIQIQEKIGGSYQS